MLDPKELVYGLRELADKIERGEISLNRQRQYQMDVPEIEGLFDVNTPERKVINQLNTLTIDQLKRLVGKYSLDPGQLVRKWKNKDRVIKYILERRDGLIDRHKGF